MVAPARTSYVPSYLVHEPYISAAEFLAAPTGVNVSQLAVGKNEQTNDDVLAQTILNASGHADNLCQQTLACTPDVVYLSGARVQGGRVLVPVRQDPLVQVNAVTIGELGSTTPMTDLSGIVFPALNVVSIPYAGPGPVEVQVEYLAGYPSSFTASAVYAGSMTFTVTDTNGFVPGAQIQFSDPGGTEYATVADATGTTVTLTSPTLFEHVKGTHVGAVPGAIKQAVILLTAVLIKSRESGAVVINSMTGGSVEKQAMDPAVRSHYDQAVSLLRNYRRVV